MNPKLFAVAAAAAIAVAGAGGYFLPRLLLGGGASAPDGVHAAFMPQPGAQPPTFALGGPPGEAAASPFARMSPEELDRAQAAALAGFALENGTMYGATSVCAPQAAQGVLACSNLIITKWSQLTRLPQPKEPNLPQVVAQNWTKAADAARKAQSGQNPPVTCEQVAEMVRRSPIWGVCDRIQAMSPLDGAPPAQPQGQAGGREQQRR